ncbi:hypothetical protein QTP81_02300 [Alteromonas sp. ASW11-36]|uniref:Uncharacterized protein n=1 Tax=Alteromonas arenosi TaxID=3055817 RepID=A0ABT7STB7_9ALTE|nr:hypothetical protein [Alteromonas sp. ASW11-36]MDM7859434.1 hypothetical protein [Alteromonas sp. ASW11-36]
MKLKSLFGLVFFALSLPALAGNYILKIDGKLYEIGLGEQTEVRIGDKVVSVSLDQKAVLTYSSQYFSFDHPREFVPAKSDLGSGLYQTATMTPLGSVVLVQEYTTMSPVSLLDLMINEITKVERQYGYNITEEPKAITLKDGKVVKGKMVYSKYNDTDIERFIGVYGNRDSGVLIMTQIDFGIDSGSQPFIQGVLDSLVLKL